MVEMLCNMEDSSALMELRKRKRFILSAPALFNWERPDGTLQQGEGTIRDISGRGAFLMSASTPPVGEHIEIEVYLPDVSGRGRPLSLHGEGKTTRTEQIGGRRGFAVDAVFRMEL